MSEAAAPWACRPGRQIGVGGLGLALALALAAPAGAEAPADGILAVGLLAHDRGPASDETEDGGVDLSLEVLFAPLDLPGSPRPHLGATLNFDGETSAAYAGLTARALERSRWFADLFLGAAVHNGPLHKDPLACEVDSDCGYGVRVLPRFGLEAGYRIGPDAAVSVYLDHTSHKWLIGGENEGLDHTGVRYLRFY